jgi:hypothetical protein
MDNPATGLKIKLARTLWFNTYRALVEDSAGEYLASLRLIPAIPLDRASVPEDAPEVAPYLLVVVEDAVFSEEELINFEGEVAGMLLARMAQPDFNPAFCQFAYPSAPRGAGPQVMELGG